jgi:TonB family protein
MCRFLTLHLIAAIALTFAVQAPPAHCQAELVVQHVRDEYRGKTLLLRGFYSGDQLQYDSGGLLVTERASGDWTVDGVVRVTDVGASSNHLIIEAERLHWGWATGGLQVLHDLDGKSKPDKDEKKNRALRIEVVFGSGTASPETTEAALSRIFLTSQDSFAELLPDYWKPCVREGLTSQDESKKQDCRFSPEFLAIPGVVSHSDTVASADPADASSSKATSSALYHVGHGVSPPRAIHQVDPEFSDPARKAKFQGRVVLGLVVEASGNATNIHIVSPLGGGLDEKAVHAVETWKFKPAEKDGQPVRVEIAVEVEFRLY